MDVRCEKCGTEYELDEAKVTEAGVTVKCTSCGNLFKVRRRGAGASVVTPTPQPVARVSRPMTLPPPVSDVPAGQTQVGGWMVRNANGQTQRFRELTTLQQWIVERKVNRECEISRTGESWRKLGDIAELHSFFQVVDLADANARAAAEAQQPRRSTHPYAPPGTTPAPRTGTTPQPSQGLPPAKVPTLTTPVVPPPRAPSSLPASTIQGRPGAGAPLTTLQGHEQRQVPGSASPLPAPMPRAVSQGPSGGLPPAMPAPAGASGPTMSTGRQVTLGDTQGPTGGMKGAPSLEPGWAGSTDAVRRTRAQLAEDAAEDAPTNLHRPMGEGPPPAFEPYDADDDLPAPASKTPWLVAGLLVILLGGGAGIYFALAGKKAPAEAAAPADAAQLAAVPADASQPTTTPIVVPPPAPDAAALLANAWKLFYDDGDAAFEAAEKAFEQARGTEPEQDAAALAGLALTNSAWAQALLDDADASVATDARRAEQLRAEARRRVERADKFVKDALARAPRSADAAIAAADVKRLQKGKPAEIDKLLAGAIGHPEANYVKGMTRLAAGQPGEARKLLEIAAADFLKNKGREHLRARYHLALIAMNDKRVDDARRELATVLGASPEHVRGRALESRLSGEAAPAAPADAGPPAQVTKPPGETAPVGDAYDTLVDKGNARAENGDCAGAMPLFERALDVRPGGVEALTGLGYCHLDRKEYARAQASFRAALGVSPRFGDAIMGLAEAYRFQGQNEQALEAYKRYLDSNPNGPKAEMARRQVKNLSPVESPPPPPPPTETPAPTPPPEGTTVPAPSSP